MRRVLLITVDGWGTKLVGCYGNALCSTPNLDQIAAKGIVFDRCWTSSSSVKEVLASIITGRHPLGQAQSDTAFGTDALESRPLRSLFMTDDADLVGLPILDSLDEFLLIEPKSDSIESESAMAEEWTSTHLAHFVESALGELSQLNEQPGGIPDLVWMHLTGLGKLWDAPFELRTLLCDPEVDPDPPTGTQPISFEVCESSDLDQVFGATCIAAAQGIVIDELFGWINAFIDQLPDANECLLIVMGTRGYPLGEHHSVGYANKSPFSEMVHVPLIVHPRQNVLGSRDPRLVQPMSIGNTILDWLQGEHALNTQVSRAARSRRPLYPSLLVEENTHNGADQKLSADACLVETDTSTAIQIARWTMVWEHSASSLAHPLFQSQNLRLYLTPDDRWQQNNVVTRAAEVAEALTAYTIAYRAWLKSGAPEDLCPEGDECLHRTV